MDSFCCITKTDILNNKNFPQTFNFSDSQTKIDLNKSLNKMERKSLSSTEIRLGKAKKKSLQISTIAKMP